MTMPSRIAIAGDARERVRHERRRLADRDNAQRLPLQPRSDADETDGAIDQMVRGRSFDRRACNGQDVLAKIGQGEVSVNVLGIAPARQSRHDVELPKQTADQLVGVFLR